MKLLSVKQAAQELGITRQGMEYLIKSGVLDPTKVIKVNRPIVRIYSSEIDKLKKQRKKQK